MARTRTDKASADVSDRSVSWGNKSGALRFSLQHIRALHAQRGVATPRLSYPKGALFPFLALQ